MPSDKEPSVYIVFLEHNSPHQHVSTVDLVKSYLDQVETLHKTGEWWRHIIFRDDDEAGTIMGAYRPDKVIGVFRGVMPEKAGRTR